MSYRRYAFTVNGTQDDWPAPIQFIESDMDYLLVGKEVGVASQLKHLQGYVEFKNKIRLGAAKALLGVPTAHLEPCKGDAESNVAYCKKGQDFVEHGTKKVNGKRKDYEGALLAIGAGEVTPGDVLETNPMFYHQYGRTIEAVHSRFLKKSKGQARTELVDVTWIYGGTGTGKSHYAYTTWLSQFGVDFKSDGDKYFVKCFGEGDVKWWDDYDGQRYIILNEFRGQIPYAEMLSLIDKWPHQVSRRCKSPMNMCATHFCITSSMPPHLVYQKQSHRDEADSINQLIRRLTKLIHAKTKDNHLVRDLLGYQLEVASANQQQIEINM